MVDDFLARYPEFQNVDKGRLNLALEDAALGSLCSRLGKLHQKAYLRWLRTCFMWGSADQTRN